MKDVNIRRKKTKRKTKCVCAGIDFKQKIINLDGTPIKLQIW